jgi:predicted small integral membrane protein
MKIKIVKIILAIAAVALATVIVYDKKTDYIYAGILLVIVALFMNLDRNDDVGH